MRLRGLAVVDTDRFLEACGSVRSVDELTQLRAISLARLVGVRDDIGAHPIETRAGNHLDWVILDVDVDVGSVVAVDVQRRERFAIGFRHDDDEWPLVRSLRADFPRDLIHLMVVSPTEPVALCLSEEAWVEARRRWTPAGFLALIRIWLCDAAEGRLHRQEQAVEPFLSPSASYAVIPSATFSLDNSGKLMVGGLVMSSEQTGRPVYIFEFEDHPRGTPKFVATVMTTKPRVHGVLHRSPQTLEDLLGLFGEDDPEFAEHFDAHMLDWLKQPHFLDAHLLLLIQIPMGRTEGGTIERTDGWGFLFAKNIREVSKALDLWDDEGGSGALVLPFNRRNGPFGSNVPIEQANVIRRMDPASAAAFNGRQPSGLNLVAIGTGALGSQILANLARVGETPCTVIDNDTLLPHNLARHAAWGGLVGSSKVEAARILDGLIRERIVPMQALIANAAHKRNENDDPVELAITSSDVVLDMAASIAVSRRLARDTTTGGRRISAFLSPNGLDLVVLREDAKRSVPLDHLEMNYYHAAVNSDQLTGHLELPGMMRYARSCRERSSLVPQTAVALHAAIATEQVLQSFSRDEAAASVWRIRRDSMSVSRVDLDTRPMRTFICERWTVFVTEDLLYKLSVRRSRALPSETGGVLMGEFDLDRKLIYVVHYLPPPPDSVEETNGFVRGAEGLEAEVKAVEATTHGMLRYVGEWHSHPPKVRARPSGEDIMLYAHLAEAMEIEERPPVMLIASNDEFAVVISSDKFIGR